MSVVRQYFFEWNVQKLSIIPHVRGYPGEKEVKKKTNADRKVNDGDNIKCKVKKDAKKPKEARKKINDQK